MVLLYSGAVLEGTVETGPRQEVGGVRSRATTWLAWSLCALTVVLVGGVVAFTLAQGAHLQGMTFLMAVVASALVGAVVASHRPRNPIGWFFLASAACFAAGEATFRYAVYGIVVAPGTLPGAEALVWPQTWLWAPGVALIIVFLPLYFPDGLLLSPRWRPVLGLAVLYSGTTAVVTAFMPGEVSDVSGVTNPLGIEALRPALGAVDAFMVWSFPVVIFLCMTSLVVRFWRSRGEERQQMKWLTYAVAAMLGMILITNMLDVADSALYPVADTLAAVVFAGIPVAAGIAVLKYRLYDIDVVINRTLVYGSLTITLLALYLGAIVTLQRVFVALTGQQSTLAVVATTLLIAALFNPLRRRIQSFIDRRFYRRKYDARKTLEAFSEKLRDEADLSALSEDLIGVVSETMQPSAISLWLREPGRDAGRRA
jgi:hypothetical protein